MANDRREYIQNGVWINRPPHRPDDQVLVREKGTGKLTYIPSAKYFNKKLHVRLDEGEAERAPLEVAKKVVTKDDNKKERYEELVRIKNEITWQKMSMPLRNEYSMLKRELDV